MQEATTKATHPFDALQKNLFHFFTEPLSPHVWGVYRIAIAAFVLLQYLILLPDLSLIFGKNGIVLWGVTDNLVSRNLPTFGKIAEFSAFSSVDAQVLLFTVYTLFMGSLFFLLLGWRANWMAFLAWVLHMFFMHSSQLSAYGVEAFTNVVLFFAVFSPIGQSFVYRNGQFGSFVPIEPSAWSRVSLRALQIHLCIVYLATGIEKMMGQEWWNGNAIWYSLMEEQFNQFDFSWLASVPLMAKIMGWSVLLLETGYPIFIWLKPIRKYWLIGILSLHTGIALFMGLQLFGLIMIILNLCAFGGIFYEDLSNLYKSISYRIASRTLPKFLLFGRIYPQS